MGNRTTALILAGVLLVGVFSAIAFSLYVVWSVNQTNQLHGLIGSEKEAFFNDPDVIAALAKHDPPIEVTFDKVGSRAIANNPKLEDVETDFAFPSGNPAAKKVAQVSSRVLDSDDLFFSPMVLVSWQPIVDILEANGFVQNKGNYYTINMEKLLQTIATEQRWNDLDNNEAFDVNKRILITSTDVRKSNSAAMYLALASFINNSNTIVQNEQQIEPLLPQLKDLFFAQGYVEESSAGPFENLVIMGMGKAPLTMVYESQYIYWMTTGDGEIYTPTLVALYPEPTVFTEHVLLPLTEEGRFLLQALQFDPTLQKLMVKHGFRTQNLQEFQSLVEKHDLNVPISITSQADLPSFEMLEAMIQKLETQ